MSSVLSWMAKIIIVTKLWQRNLFAELTIYCCDSVGDVYLQRYWSYFNDDYNGIYHVSSAEEHGNTLDYP